MCDRTKRLRTGTKIIKMAYPERSTLESSKDLAYATGEGERARVVEDDGIMKDSTEAELTKIRLMRAFVETQDPSSKVTTNHRFPLSASICLQNSLALARRVWVEKLGVKKTVNF